MTLPMTRILYRRMSYVGTEPVRLGHSLQETRSAEILRAPCTCSLARAAPKPCCLTLERRDSCVVGLKDDSAMAHM